jgi:hypothetical protein
MKKIIQLIFATLVGISYHVYAQGSTTITRIPKNYPTFQVGGIGSLDFCFRTLENKEGAVSLNELIVTRNNGEMPKFGYHAGIGFCINASEHFGMETGIMYSNQGYETKLMNYLYPVPDPSLPTKGRSIYNYNFLDIPLKANFFIGKGKVRFFGSVGIIANILVAQNETFVKKYEDGRTEYEVFKTSDNFEKVVFAGTLSAGIDVKFNKHLNLRLGPHFGHHLGRFKEAAVSQYLWTAGFGAGFYYGWW